MRLIEGAKARAMAVAMSAAALTQVWPNAHAAEPTEAPKDAIKTSKRKRTGGEVAIVALRAAPTGEVAVRPPKRKLPPPTREELVENVIERAKAQLGEPYRWAAVGPDSFDCSGFTLYSWRAAGVELPHNSGAQRAATKPVPLSEAKPGDLVFAPGHVGMIIGKGKMIHSPRSGRTVEIAPLHSNAYGAGRVQIR